MNLSRRRVSTLTCAYFLRYPFKIGQRLFLVMSNGLIRMPYTNEYLKVTNELANNKKYFNINYENYIHEDKEDHDSYNAIQEWTQDKLNESSILLDAGCGSGIISKAFKNKYNLDNTIGFDISNEMCYKAKKESYIDNIMQCDIMNLPFREKIVDMIYINCVFHHLVSNSRRESKELVKKVIKNFLNIVNKNGYVYIRELYYESYFDELLTNYIIFYLLYIIKIVKTVLKNQIGRAHV